MNNINYANIAKSVDHFTNVGFNQIEVPWWVTEELMELTKPKEANSAYQLSVNQKYLIASGEQGLLYLANKGQLPLGKYCTVTPCFRNEEYDSYHSKQFLKHELMILYPARRILKSYEVISLANQVLKFYQIIEPNVEFSIIDANSNNGDINPLDIVANIGIKQIEVGSFGIRSSSFATWIYGTGLAEPRFSKVCLEASFNGLQNLLPTL